MVCLSLPGNVESGMSSVVLVGIDSSSLMSSVIPYM